MLSLIIIFMIVIMLFAIKSYRKEISKMKKTYGYITESMDEYPIVQIVTAIICFVIIIVSFLFSIISAVDILGESATRNNITMYEMENEKIESSVSELIEKYMNYESDIFNDMENKSDMILVSLYPDLKSDELVKQQIEIYNENNAEIKELKEKLNNLETMKKIVFFWELF